MEETATELSSEEQIQTLKSRVAELEKQLQYEEKSTFLRSALRNMVYEVDLDRAIVMEQEFGKRIDESLGTMQELKNQASRMARIIGLDSDMIRILVTEAVQNILEHGHGNRVTVRFELEQDPENPCLISTFKNEMPPGRTYTMADINRNSLKGDVTSGYFDFENPRGRGEFLIKQLTDERRIVNGIEINHHGEKINYFKRILINYRNPEGPRKKIAFHELKLEIDRLDYEDVICLFHVKHNKEKPDAVTIAATRTYMPIVEEILGEKGYQKTDEEDYYRTRFATFLPGQSLNKDELLQLFKKVRQVIHQEIDS